MNLKRKFVTALATMFICGQLLYICATLSSYYVRFGVSSSCMKSSLECSSQPNCAYSFVVTYNICSISVLIAWILKYWQIRVNIAISGSVGTCWFLPKNVLYVTQCTYPEMGDTNERWLTRIFMYSPENVKCTNIIPNTILSYHMQYSLVSFVHCLRYETRTHRGRTPFNLFAWSVKI